MSSQVEETQPLVESQTDDVAMASEGLTMDKAVEKCIEMMAQDEAAKKEAEAIAEATARDTAGNVSEATLKECVMWMRNCSKHLSHIEMRAMEGALLGHEVVRQMLQFWTTFVPGPLGDWAGF